MTVKEVLQKFKNPKKVCFIRNNAVVDVIECTAPGSYLQIKAHYEEKVIHFFKTENELMIDVK